MDFSLLHNMWFFLSSLFSFILWCTMHMVVHVHVHVFMNTVTCMWS